MEAQPSPAGSPGAITSTLGERKQDKVLRLSRLQDAGLMREEHASLAKAFCTARARETVG